MKLILNDGTEFELRALNITYYDNSVLYNATVADLNTDPESIHESIHKEGNLDGCIIEKASGNMELPKLRPVNVSNEINDISNRLTIQLEKDLEEDKA